MLDWFTRRRLSEEQGQGFELPTIGQILPDFVLTEPEGTLFFLSEIHEVFALLVMPFELSAAQSYRFRLFAEKYSGVRPEITRVVVVTRPEHLSTVVALAGDMLILSDDSDEVVLRLGSEEPTLYFVDDHRQVLNRGSMANGFPSLIPRSLRPAA